MFALALYKTASATAGWHHHPHSPFHQHTFFLSHVTVPSCAMHLCTCAAMALNNCWRWPHHTSTPSNHQRPQSFHLSLTQHTLAWGHHVRVPTSFFGDCVVGTLSIGTLTESPQKGEKDYDTWCSQVVSNPSTNQARRGLTSLIRREVVLSSWYGRNSLYLFLCSSFWIDDKRRMAWVMLNKHTKVALLFLC